MSLCAALYKRIIRNFAKNDQKENCLRVIAGIYFRQLLSQKLDDILHDMKSD